jgi:type III secretion system low calcium response chaperone LcrH/SycD
MTNKTLELDHSEADSISQVLSSFLSTGGTFSDALSDNADFENETMYAVGYNLYEQARYHDAFKIFSLLVIRNHLEPRYLSGLAGVCQMLGRYVEALQHYMAVVVADMNNPKPIFHAAECLIALSRREEARDSLKLVLDMCSDPKDPLHGRALMLLQRL